jgi:urease accessory protein UreH
MTTQTPENHYQTAFEIAMNATKVNSEDPHFSPEVRRYAATVYMAMYTQAEIIRLQEAEEVEALIESFRH